MDEMEKMYSLEKMYSSAQLAKQVAEKLGLNQKEALELYKDLAQIGNGPVKDALHALSVKGGRKDGGHA